ncbi:UNVERIFIED_CONTAM: hypothetical protein O8I53_07780 [Campylobacter lari]
MKIQNSIALESGQTLNSLYKDVLKREHEYTVKYDVLSSMNNKIQKSVLNSDAKEKLLSEVKSADSKEALILVDYKYQALNALLLVSTVDVAENVNGILNATSNDLIRAQVFNATKNDQLGLIKNDSNFELLSQENKVYIEGLFTTISNISYSELNDAVYKAKAILKVQGLTLSDEQKTTLITSLKAIMNQNSANPEMTIKNLPKMKAFVSSLTAKIAASSNDDEKIK